MLASLWRYVMFSAALLCLLLIDYILGNGFVELFQRIFCKLVCFIRKSIQKQKEVWITEDVTVSLTVVITEIIFLGLITAFLKKYKQIRPKDRIDVLLQESRETLRQANEFLEKWRLRRLMQTPIEYSYLDDEPQEITPLKLEVPIPHMAIVDAIGTTRNQPESGDAGDHASFTDSALLSMISLLDEDEDFDSIPDVSGAEKIDNIENVDFRSRILWDVLEEDTAMDE